MTRINRTLLGQYAGFITRGAALIIDIVIVSVSVIVINWMISLPVTYFLNIDIQQCVQTPEAYGFIGALTCRFISFSWLLVTLLTAPLYFSILMSLNGQTLGKYVMGVRVVRLDGRRLSFFQSFLRWIGYFLSAIPLGLGFFMSLVDDRRRTLHDRMVGTCVVYSWKARRNEFTVDRVDKWLDGDAHAAKTLPGPSTSVTLSPIYDLIAIDVRSFGEVRTTMNILTEGVAKGEYADCSLDRIGQGHRGRNRYCWRQRFGRREWRHRAGGTERSHSCSLSRAAEARYALRFIHYSGPASRSARRCYHQSGVATRGGRHSSL